MKTKSELWSELKEANVALGNLEIEPADELPRSIELERELAVNAPFFAEHVAQTVTVLGDAASTWVTNLLTGDRGWIGEAYAFGTFSAREVNVQVPVPIPRTELYREAGDEPGTLDGCFHPIDILFDIKSLSRPSSILDRLTDSVNQQLNQQDITVRVDGSLDFDQRILQNTFGQCTQAILDNAEAGTAFTLPGTDWRFRYFPSSQPFQTNEGTFNPYRFALENRYTIATHADQVHRQRRNAFVLVYSSMDHEIAQWPEYLRTAERALARRAFIELAKDGGPAVVHCPNADPTSTVQGVMQSVGAMFFLSVRPLEGDVSLSAFLNPNANEGQRVTLDHLEQLTDFNLGNIDEIDDFEFDNY